MYTLEDGLLRNHENASFRKEHIHVLTFIL